MTAYTDPTGRRLSEEQIAREWIRRHPDAAAKLVAAIAPRGPRFHDEFGVDVYQDSGGTVILTPLR